MAFDVHHINVNMAGTSPVGTTIYPVLWAVDSQGGGISVLKVTYSSPAAVAAASAAQFELVTLGTNSAINGTIATALGSAAFTAGTIRNGTISAAFVDAPYALAVKKIQTSANGDEATYSAQIMYVLGR